MIIWSLVPEIWSATDRIFCHSGPFLPSYPTNNMKNQKFENMKNTWDISILYLCTTNDNHMMYSSWDMEQDRQNFLSFWAFFFCPFTYPTSNPQKTQFWNKELETSLYTCAPQLTILWRIVPEIQSATDRIFSHFGPFFALLPH